jgi:hypothetical protein
MESLPITVMESSPEIYSLLTVRRNRILRIAFSFIFLSLLYAYSSHALIHQLQAPVLKFPYVDAGYWLIHLTGIPELITGSRLFALLLDSSLFVFCFLAILFPSRRTFPALFMAAYTLYFFIFNSYGAHHTHSKIGILLMPVPFLFKQASFPYLWKGLRYYLLFAYSAAFCWKLFRLSWLHADQGLLILKKNVAPYLYFHSDTLPAQFYQWLLRYPTLPNAAYLAGFLAEGCFIVGFFTTRYDKALLVLSILLPVGFYIMADAFFSELLILSLTLFFPACLSFTKNSRKQGGRLPENGN